MASRLVPLVQSVLAGDISPSAAIDRIRQAATQSAEADVRPEDAALVDPAVVLYDIRELLDRLGQESSHLRVQDGGQVVVEAARIVLDSLWAARAALEVGFRLMQLDQPSFAISWLTDAEAALRQAGDTAAPMAAEFRLRALGALGDWSAQLEAATAAEAEAGEGRFRVMVLMRRAEALLRLGRVDDARPVIEQSLAAFDAAPAESNGVDEASFVDEVELVKLKGEIARAQGDFEAALAAFERARDAALHLGQARAAAFMLSEIGITWERAGEIARAATVLEAARAEAAQLGDWRSVLRWGGSVAQEKIPLDSLDGSNLFAYAARQMLEPKPDYAQVRQLALRSIEEARRVQLLELEAQSRNLLAAAYEGLDASYQALAAVAVAIEIAERIDNPALELTFRMNRARLQIGAHRFPDAEEELARIFTIGDRLLDEIGTSELRQTVRVMLARACEYAVICASLSWSTADGSSPREPDPDRWIDASQRGQAQNLTAWLALANLVERSRDEAFAEAVRKLRAADVTVERLATCGELLGAALAVQQRELQQFRQIARAAGQATSVLAPRLTRPEVEAAVPRRSIVVALYPLKDSVGFAAFGGPNARCGRIKWTDANRERWLLRWDLAHADARARLAPGGGTRGWRLIADLSAAGALKSDGPREPLDRLLDELDARFLTPLRQQIGEAADGRRLMVVPHVNLSMLPFWRWARAESDEAVSIVPSLGCLTLLAARERPVTGTWIKIGDVTGTLKMVERELAALPDHQSIAPVLDVVASEAPGASIVHFAGHGYFNRPRPYDSGLVLGTPGRPRPHVPDPWRGEHAMLTVSDIVADLAMPRCFLTTLSACCTGVPRRHAASEFTSLPAALLVAGARNVIASLWPAHDGAAALLMEELYRGIDDPAGTWSPSAALARARSALAQLTREEAVVRLGTADALPAGDHPFSSPLFTMTFQHYGVD